MLRAHHLAARPPKRYRQPPALPEVLNASSREAEYSHVPPAEPGADNRPLMARHGALQFPRSVVLGYTLQMERIVARSARHQFTAQRDENGVPHVQANSWH